MQYRYEEEFIDPFYAVCSKYNSRCTESWLLRKSFRLHSAIVWRLAPVSYTHLDVYKRQDTCRMVLSGSGRCLCIRQCADLFHRRRTIRARCRNRHQHTEATRPRSDGSGRNHHIQMDYRRFRTDQTLTAE